MKTLHPIAFAFCALLLSACTSSDPVAGDPMPELEEIAQELADLLESDSAPDSAGDDAADDFAPEPIRIPRDAPWLGEIRFRTYQADPATAINEILPPGTPVRYELLREIPNILVFAPSGQKTISQHLDHITRQADWSWSFDAGVIRVLDTISNPYSIAAPPGAQNATIPMRALTQDANATAGAGGGGGAAGGGAGGASSEEPENNFEIELDAWETLETLLTQTLGIAPAQSPVQSLLAPPTPIGASNAEPSFTMIREANLVYVTASPSIHQKVSDLIDQFNASINERVLLTVTVFELDFTDTNRRSFDLRLLRQAASAADIRLTGNDFDLSDANGLSIKLTSNEGNAYDASNLLLTLLNTQGQTSIRLHERFEIVNNIPVSISDQRTIPYVASISTGNQIGGAVSQLSTEVRTQQLNTGIALNVLASIAGERVNVRLGYSQAALVRLETYDIGEGASGIAGTLPITDSSHRLFRMSLNNGDTRLIANVTQTSITDRESSNTFGFLGGSRAVQQQQRQTIIAVTAQILEPAA